MPSSVPASGFSRQPRRWQGAELHIRADRWLASARRGQPRQRKHRYQHRRQKLEGWNNGYQHGDGRSEIQIVPFAGDPNADPTVRAVFVAEMSEIFMTYRNKLMGPTWIEN